MKTFLEYITEANSESKIYVLYHGTTTASAENLLKNGWRPDSWCQGNQCGQTKYLYLTNEPENAEWYAQEKDSGVVLKVLVDKNNLKVDPEDGTADNIEDELSLKYGLPGSVVAVGPIPKENFSYFNKGTNKELTEKQQAVNLAQNMIKDKA